MIREWRAEILGNGTSVSEAAKAYRFLRAVLMTAVDDQLIPRNPCRIRGAGTERPEERPVLTVRQVLDLAERMPDDRFGVMVLLAAFASLRWGELCALRRCDLDPVAGTVSVRRQQVELDTGQVIITAPKSALESGSLRCRLPSSVRSGSTWRRATISRLMRRCSPAPAAGRFAAATSGAMSAGPPRWPLSALRGCIFMIFAIPATHWPPRAGRACGI
jgi:integrase